LDQVVLAEAGTYSGQHVEVEVLTDDGGRRECLGRVLAEAGHPLEDDIAQGARYADVANVVRRCPATVALDDRARLGQMSEDLSHEERVSRCLLLEQSGEVDLTTAWGVLLIVGKKTQHVILAEPSEGDPLEPPRA